MTEPENLTLVCLRRMDTKLDKLSEGFGELKLRMTTMEGGLNNLRREVLKLHETTARQQASLDGLRDDVRQINRRLDLRDEAGAGV